MQAANDVMDELRTLGSRLAGMPKAMPYAVPGGYFEGLTNRMAEEVQAAGAAGDSPLPFPFPKAAPYAVPEGYFAGLAARALHAAKASDAVPAGYFEAMPQAMLQAAKVASASSVPVRRKARIIAMPAVRWAAAAALVVGLTLGGRALLNNTSSPVRAIASLSADEVSLYIDEHLEEIDPDLITGEAVAALDETGLSGTTADELEAYLDETGWSE